MALGGAAGVLGGLDVVTRRSHSRPSGYAPLGLDATVIDGEVVILSIWGAPRRRGPKLR